MFLSRLFRGGLFRRTLLPVLILISSSSLYAGGGRQSYTPALPAPAAPALSPREDPPPDRQGAGQVFSPSRPDSPEGELPETAGMGDEPPLVLEDSPPSQETAPPGALPRRQDSRGELIMTALARAYPDRIGPAEFRDGDWAVPVGGVWFYYAEGRLLPGELRGMAAEYDPQPFYAYPAELPPWEPPSPEEEERIRSQARRRLQHPSNRSSHFFDALWRASNRDEAWERVKSLRFLGRPVYVHYSILEELALVEERILAESRTDAQIRQWIDGLDILDGWNWRSIADTRSRSFHSYGAALDLLPKSRGNLETYWLWTSRSKSDWWTVPYDRRFHPPDAVIRAFESYGFAWGGKWLYYDTMHFEYRPEIFILSGLPLDGPR